MIDFQEEPNYDNMIPQSKGLAGAALSAMTPQSYDQLQAQKRHWRMNCIKYRWRYITKTPRSVIHSQQPTTSKAMQQGVVAAAQQVLAKVNPELDNFDNGMENVLLEAISQQRWWFIKNKREIVYDSHTGFLWPNFEFVALETWKTWKAVNEYALSAIGKGKWIGDYAYISNQQQFDELWSAVTTLPNRKSIAKNTYFNFGKISYIYSSCYLYSNDGFKSYSSTNSRGDGEAVMPSCRLYANPNLSPLLKKYTALEKAQMVLDFFLQQGWHVVFDNPEHQKIFDAVVLRKELQAQLVSLEQQIAQLPKPEVKTQFTSDFDYTQPLRNYNVTAVNQSVWQYTLNAQRWINYLLTQLDDWSRENQALLDCAQKINTNLTQKLPLGKGLSDTEKAILQNRRQDLQARLNFNLEPLRAALISFGQQATTLEKDLHTLNGQADSLSRLAQVAQQPRPPFELLAEHTATLCTQNLKKLEWLGERQAFVEQLVAAEKVWAENYTVFIDKYQPDLYAQATENNIDSHEVDTWFSEWRRERLQIEAQCLPLAYAGLDKTLDTTTVLAVLQVLTDYQQQLDKFYLQERQGIHTKFAFAPNGHRQEKLEKELELAKLAHHFMEQLQQHIFAIATTAQKYG
ncbi:MAG: hypothetical protein IPI79_06720 [Moraxellaceae bacterium]|nr:hypothetical protein [Moraxellaceae bacterium]